MKTLAGAAALVLAATLTSVPAPAEAVGVDSCPHAYVTQTNDWHVFWSRKVRAYERACLRIGNGDATHPVNYMMMTFVRRPVITFPSAMPVPSGEKITLVRAPWLYRVDRHYGDMVRVYWRFSAKSCTVFCNTVDFAFNVGPGGTQLCVIRGSRYANCDPFDRW